MIVSGTSTPIQFATVFSSFIPSEDASGINSSKRGGEVKYVTVRWFDGYLESFEATDVRFGNALLWIKLAITDENRHIPLREVRWFSVEESK